MRIAYLGLKGLPGTYSGIETHVHELGTRLAERGHEVTAYVRPHYTPRHILNDNGIRLVHVPTIPSKHLDAGVHSFLAAIHSLNKNYDVIHFHTIGPGCFSLLSRLSHARVVVTIHRFDYLSGKWGWYARSCLRVAEQICLRAPHGVITVAPFLEAHYRSRGHQVTYIPNGVSLPPAGTGCSKIAELGLIPNQYAIFLGRLVPEKRPDWVVRAFQRIQNGSLRLVISGGSSATDQFVRELKSLAGPSADRIVFTGPVYGSLKDELLANAKAFVLPSALEGLPITLLEAMGHARPCLVSDIPPHRDVLRDGETGYLHRADDFDHLRDRLREIICADPQKLFRVGESAKKAVAKEYDWQKIVDQTEQLYEDLLPRPRFRG